MEKDICGVCLDIPTLTIKLDCEHKFCYLCIKQCFLSDINGCPLCRTNICPEILNKACAFEDINDETGIWQYESRTIGEWWFYENGINNSLEIAWTKDLKQINVEILGVFYKINFKTMTQTSTTGYSRRIRRNNKKEEVKGIAGLIYKDKFDTNR